MTARANRRHLSLMLLATLLLRASIPDGYMPAPIGTGLPFVLCPSGVPAGFMAVLGGSEHHHHHNAEGGADAGVETSQCPIGHILIPALAGGDHCQDIDITRPPDFAVLPDTTYSSATPIKPRSRGPPA